MTTRASDTCQVTPIRGDHDRRWEDQDVVAPIAPRDHHGVPAPLRKLLDRALLRDRLSNAIVGATRDGRITGVLCLGLEGLSEFREQHGRTATQQLLMLAGERLLATVRKADTAAHLDDGEYVIVQVRLERPEGAYALVRRLIGAFTKPFTVEGATATLGITIGIAIAESDSEDAECWLQQARLARLRAKADGPGAYRCSNPELDAQLLVRRSLEADLRRALVEEQLTLHYQPIVELATRRVVGFEALLRWQHPTRGLLMPSDFLHVAEDSGQIVDLGAWVLRQACADARSWPCDVKVAVNLSPVQFAQSGITAAVTDALEANDIDPRRLIIEVNEDILLRGNDHALRTLHALKSLGMGIAMDDFGTGRSSLSHLQSFPFDRIKIDQSLMFKTESQPTAAAIVRAVISVGRSLGMTVTAEGVETERQLAFLREEGCDEVQGFYFSRPMPNQDIHRLITLIEAQRAQVTETGQD